MRIRRSVVLPTVATLAILLVAITWSHKDQKEPKVAPKETKSKPRYHKKEKFIQLSDEFTWDSVTEPELEEFNDFFEDKISPHGFKSKIIVVPGETVITDVYEGLPGEFVFSQLTPEIRSGEDGLPMVEVFAEAKKLLLDGTVETIWAKPVEAPPGGLSWSIGTDEGIYRLKLIGNHDDIIDVISLDLEGRFIPNPNN